MTSGETLEYRDSEVRLSATLLHPPANARAAVAVFPTIMNPTPAVMAKAHALAEAGYLVLVADFYGRNPSDFADAGGLSDALRSDPVVYRARLQAALTALRSVSSERPVLAIGFCMGGQAVLELARDGADLAVVVSFHGLLDTKAPALPGAIKARILVCHGDADPLVPRAQVLAFWEEMDRANADWHFHAYSGVLHGFTNPNPPPDNSAVAYNESADRQSWTAMHALFDEVLTSVT